MKSIELYYTFSLLLNKNNEDKNINVKPENFVILYNREKDRWLTDYIELNNSSDNIFNLDDLIVRDYKLTEIETKKDYSVYSVPNDLFSVIHGDFRSTIDSECKALVYNRMYKPQDINTVLEDQFLKPSLPWQRGVAKVSRDNIVVYKNNFDVKDTTISYFKVPRNIDLEGYINFDNTPSTNIDPDTNDYICNHILDRVVTEVTREFNQSLYQVAKTREKGL